MDLMSAPETQQVQSQDHSPDDAQALSMKRGVSARRNRYAFAMGTVGRDMLYILVTSYLLFFMTDILTLPNSTIGWVTIILLVNRLYDGFNDPFMGMIIDNTRSRFGKFKPWIAGGAVFSAIFTVLLFTDFGLRGTAFVIAFAFLTFLWEISFTANDIAYWSMFPVLTLDLDERERIGALARACANIGRFVVIVTVLPLIRRMATVFGGEKPATLVYAILVAIIMLAGQCITLFGVRERRMPDGPGEKASIRDLFRAIIRNDQLLVISASMLLFTVGYSISTGFSLYFFKYAYGDTDMFSYFSIILAITQVLSLTLFPILSHLFTRRSIFQAATVMVVAGLALLFVAPMNMLFIGPAGFLMIAGQAWTEVLALLFLADTVEYGQHKLGQRHESVVFSVLPLISKISNSLAIGVIGATVVISGINDAVDATDVTPDGLLLMKAVMCILPIGCCIASYLLYRSRYKIDRAMHDQLMSDLAARSHSG